MGWPRSSSILMVRCKRLWLYTSTSCRIILAPSSYQGMPFSINPTTSPSKINRLAPTQRLMPMISLRAVNVSSKPPRILVRTWRPSKIKVPRLSPSKLCIINRTPSGSFFGIFSWITFRSSHVHPGFAAADQVSHGVTHLKTPGHICDWLSLLDGLVEVTHLVFTQTPVGQRRVPLRMLFGQLVDALFTGMKVPGDSPFTVSPFNALKNDFLFLEAKHRS